MRLNSETAAGAPTTSSQVVASGPAPPPYTVMKSSTPSSEKVTPSLPNFFLTDWTTLRNVYAQLLGARTQPWRRARANLAAVLGPVKRFVVAVVFATKLSSGAVCEAFLPPPLGGFGFGARGALRLLRGVRGVLLAAVASRTTPRFRACPTPSKGQKPNAQKKAVSKAGIGVRISPRWLSCAV